MPSPHVRSLDDVAVAMSACFLMPNVFWARGFIGGSVLSASRGKLLLLVRRVLPQLRWRRLMLTFALRINEQLRGRIVRLCLLRHPGVQETEFRLGQSMLQERGGLGGLGRFFPRSLGRRFSWLRHLAWNSVSTDVRPAKGVQ